MRNCDFDTVETIWSVFYIYQVSNLDAACHGQVTAIEYCYTYRGMLGIQPNFNWRVMILEEIGNSNDFEISSVHIIESHSANCSWGAHRIVCCDRTSIADRFALADNFTFGALGLAQENTHNATLLGYNMDTVSYGVDARELSWAGQAAPSVHDHVTITSAPNSPSADIGLRLLWFVISK